MRLEGERERGRRRRQDVAGGRWEERAGDGEGRSVGVADEVPAGGVEVVAVRGGGGRLVVRCWPPSPRRIQGRPFPRPSPSRRALLPPGKPFSFFF